MHTKCWGDHSEFVHPHLASANGMSKTRRGEAGKFAELRGARLGPWDEFAVAHTVEGVLISKFTRGVDGAHDGRKIMIGAEIVAIDDRSILKVVAFQPNGTFAGGLDESRRDCERVRGRGSKARGYLGRTR